MGKLWKLLITPFLIPVVIALGYEAVLALIEIPFQSISWMIYGIIAYLVIYPFVSGNNLHFIEIFEHELGHAILNLISFDKITEYVATPYDGGHVYAKSAHAGFIFYLAPYFLPIFTIPFVLIQPFTNPPVQYGVEFVIGLTLGFHFVALAREFGSFQTDIQKNTYIFSLLITLLFNIGIFMAVVSVILLDIDFFIGFIQSSMQMTANIYTETWQFVQQYI